jgi:uncharacterized MAPEG superfamily protein
MTFELTALAGGCGLGLIHIVLASHSASLQRGYRWTAGARDKPLPPLTGVAGRLARASDNYGETFPMFVAAVLMSQLVGAHDWRAIAGASLYLGARIVYLPLYAAGVYLARSLVWNLATLGIALLIWAAIAP